MRCIPLLFLFSLCYNLCGAQLPAVLNVTHYNEINGLGNGRVSFILQGTTGYLWLGTTNGLLRYDGYSFRQFNDPGISNTITQLAEDSNHRIWMSFLGGGLACFNPATGSFNKYKIQNSEDSSLAAGEVTLLFFDRKGQLWMGIARKGLIKANLEKNSFTEFDVVDQKSDFYTPAIRQVYNSVYDIYEDAKGVFWLATHDGLYRFDPSTTSMNAVRQKTLEKNMRRFDLFRTILASKDTLWLGAWAGGLSSYNTTTGEWKKYFPVEDKMNGTLYNLITRVREKNNHELWICSPDLGLGTFDKTTKGFYFFSNNKNYPNVPAAEWTYMITDKDRNVWGLNNDGLVKVQAPDYRFLFNTVNVSKKDGPNFYVTGMLEDENLQLTTTTFADGLHVLDKRTGKKTILPVDVMPNEDRALEIRDIMKDSYGNIWVLARDFIYRYDTSLNQLVKISQPPLYSAEKLSNSFSHVTEDKQGNLWLTSKRNGAFMYNAAQKTYLHYSNRSDSDLYISASYVLDAATDIKGRVWLSGPYGFLAYLDPVTKKITELHSGYGSTLKLPGTQTYSLLADNKGNIWAGTFNGLCFFDCNDVMPSLQKIFLAKDGLRSNFISNIQQDNYGNIWCTTDAAVSMIHHTTYNISSYDAMDGITQGLELKIVPAPGNHLRFLGTNGYYNYCYDAVVDQRESPAPLLISRLMVNDKDFYYQDILQQKGRIDLSPDENVFSFEFAAINFSRPDKEQYSYMLEGFDKDWIDAGKRHFVSYTNIPGGYYIFKVRAAANKNFNTSQAVNIPLYIKSPFYKTFFFYFFIFLLAAGSLYWLYHNRLRHQQEVHELQSKAQLLEKEKVLVMYEGLKQQLNPHFLFNSLTSLSGLIQTNQKMAGDFLAQMSKIYRYILKNRDAEMVLLPEEIKFVTNYIHLQQTRFKQGLQVHIYIDEDYAHRKIAPVTLQNLIENAIKHNIIDAETPLVVGIFCEDEYLVVQNNLQKKEFVETSNRQGLKNMQSLYRYLTGKPIIITEDENKFTVKIPLL